MLGRIIGSISLLLFFRALDRGHFVRFESGTCLRFAGRSYSRRVSFRGGFFIVLGGIKVIRRSNRIRAKISSGVLQQQLIFADGIGFGKRDRLGGRRSTLARRPRRNPRPSFRCSAQPQRSMFRPAQTKQRAAQLHPWPLRPAQRLLPLPPANSSRESQSPRARRRENFSASSRLTSRNSTRSSTEVFASPSMSVTPCSPSVSACWAVTT